MDNKYRRTGLTGSPHFNVKTEKTKNPFYLKHGSIQTVIETVNQGTTQQYENKYYVGTGYLPMRRYQSSLLLSSVSPSDTLLKSVDFVKSFFDPVGVDGKNLIDFLVEKGLSENLNTSDVTSFVVGKNIIEPFSAVEQLSFHLRSGLRDNFNANDIVLVEVSFFKTFADEANATEEVRWNFFKTLADDAIVLDLVDVPDGSTYQFIKSLNDEAITSESLVRTWVAFREFNDAAAASETKALNLSKPFGETATVTETLQKAWSLFSPFVDAATVTHDTIALVADRVQGIADAFNSSDVQRLQITKVLEELANPSEELIWDLNKVFNNFAGPGDSPPIFTINKIFADIASAEDLVGVPDGATFQFIKTIASVADTLTTTDVLERQFTAFRTFGDTQSATDLAAILFATAFEHATAATDLTAINLSRPLDDAINTNEFLRIFVEQVTTLSDSVGLFHSPININTGKAIADGISVSDLLDDHFDIFVAKILADQATVTDLPLLNISKPLSEEFNLTELVQNLVGKVFGDNADVEEQEFHRLLTNKVIADQVNPAEASTLLTDKPLSHNVTLSEALTVIIGSLRQFADSFSIGENALFHATKHFADTATAEDLVGVPDGSTFQFVMSVSELGLDVIDALLVNLGKEFNDEAILSEERLFALAKPLQDTAAAIQQATISFETSFADQANASHPPAQKFITKGITATVANPSTVEAKDSDGVEIVYSAGRRFDDFELTEDIIDGKIIRKAISDIFAAIQQHSFIMQKPFGHSTTTVDSPAIATNLVPFVGDNSVESTDDVPDVHLTKGFFDTQAISEAIARKVLSKFISDTANVQDLVGVPDGITFQFIAALSHVATASDAINLISRHMRRNLEDTFGPSDSAILNSNKGFTDVTGPLNDAPTLNLGKVFSHGVPIAEGSPTFGVGKSLTDSQSLTDSLAVFRGIAFTAAGDTAFMGDSPTIATSTSFDHEAVASDAPVLNPGKVFGHGVTIAEGSPTFGVGKSLTDSTPPGDEITSILRFLVYGFADSTTSSENAILNSNKILAHSAATSDSHALATSTSFGHFATPGDIPALATSTSFGHGVTATFTNSINTSKGFAHSVTPGDDHNIGTSLAFGHSTTAGDVGLLFNVGILLADVANVRDLVGIPDGITFRWSTTFEDQITSSENAAKAFSTGQADTASTSEAGNLIQRSYFASDYVEFDLSDPLAAYDVASTQSF